MDNYIRHERSRLKLHRKSTAPLFVADASFTLSKVGTFDPDAPIVNPCDVNNGECGIGNTCINKSGVAKCFVEKCTTTRADRRITDRNYEGTISETHNGVECKAWASGEHNYCRAEGNYTPWCWKVTGGWDFCKCPEIPNPCDTNNGGCQSPQVCLNNEGTAECKTIYSPQVGDIIRLEALNNDDYFIRHKDWQGYITKFQDSEPFLSDSQWKVIAGLSGQSNTFSLQSVNEGLSYLTQGLSTTSNVDLVRQEDIDKDENNKAKATWLFEAALDTKNAPAGAISIK